MTLSDTQRLQVYYSVIAPSSLSILGCLTILVIYSRYRTLRNSSAKLIAILSLFDLVNSIAFLIPTYYSKNHSASCLAQATLISFSTLAELIWTTFMAFFLYSTTKQNKFNERIIGRILVIVLCVCFACTVVPLFLENNAYGKTQGWCWIQDKNAVLRNLFFFVPVAILIPLNFIIYLRVRYLISKILIGVENEYYRKVISNRILLYPVILVICYVPYTVKASLEFFEVVQNDFVFTMVSGVLRCLHGFLNFLIYGMNSSVRLKLKYFFRKIVTRGQSVTEESQSMSIITNSLVKN